MPMMGASISRSPRTSRKTGTTTPARRCSRSARRRPFACATASFRPPTVPFAETKEQLGGFYLISAWDLNEAIQIASRVPSARIGSIEVRPVIDFNQ